MATIRLACGVNVQCDDEDFEWLSKKRWHMSTHGYAVTWFKERPHVRYMHRIVVKNIAAGMVVDHVNRNKLDNRKENLHVTTIAKNIANAPCRKANKLGQKGVTFDKKKNRYLAWGHINRKTVNIGSFKTLDQARSAYAAWCAENDRFSE